MSDQVDTPPDRLLPEEIWNLIFLKSPIKSVLIYTGVCRSWNSLIKSSSFISSYLKNSISDLNSTDLCLFKYQGFDDVNRFYFLSDDEDLTEYARLIPPPLDFGISINTFGSCNGLILFGNSKICTDQFFILWNPALRRLVKLPPLIWKKFDYAGLGFDSKANDYIVMVIYLSGEYNSNVGIYSLNSNSWKFLMEAGLDSELNMYGSNYGSESMTFLNETFHAVDISSETILSLDMHHGVCRKIMFPCVVPSDYLRLGVKINVRGGLLAYSFVGMPLSNPPTDRVFYVWVMEVYGVEESWTPLVKFELDDGMGVPRVFCFRRNGDAVLEIGSEVVLFNPRSNAMKNVVVKGGAYYVYYDCCYVQSLGLLDKGESYKNERVFDLVKSEERKATGVDVPANRGY